jgi:hypothetical protein
MTHAVKLPYDTLYKDPVLVLGELEQLERASNLTICKGANWVLGKFAPYGPIMKDRDLALCHKTAVLMMLTGRSFDLARLLDWVQANALQETGDISFPEQDEMGSYSFRAYRTSYLLRAAARSGHPLAGLDHVKSRILEFQSKVSGGVFDYIGDDPAAPEFPNEITVAPTSVFGHYALAADLEQPALAAGDWLVNLVRQNEAHLVANTFYTSTDADGLLVTDVEPGSEFDYLIDMGASAIQATWRLGISMGFLADLYDTIVLRWPASEEKAEVYLDAALRLLEFQSRMPVEAYVTLNACKLAWGAGRLLDVLLKHGLGDLATYDRLYRCARRVYMHTFLGSRRSDGSWTHDFYPLDTSAPEMAIDIRTLEGFSALPDETWRQDCGTNAIVGDIEVTAEHTAWTYHVWEGISRLRRSVADGTVRVGDDATVESVR